MIKFAEPVVYPSFWLLEGIPIILALLDIARLNFSTQFGLAQLCIWPLLCPCLAIWLSICILNGPVIVKIILKFFQFILMHQIVAITFFWILVSGAMTIPFLLHDQYRSRYVCACNAVLLTRDSLGRKLSFYLGGIWNLTFIAPYIWILGWLSWHKIQIYDNKEFLISQTIAQIQIDGVNEC